MVYSGAAAAAVQAVLAADSTAEHEEATAQEMPQEALQSAALPVGRQVMPEIVRMALLAEVEVLQAVLA